MGGGGDERPGRRRLRAAGGDVDDDGQRRVQECLHDVAHRVHAPARGVDAEDDGVCAALRRLVDGAGGVAGHSRADGAVDVGDEHLATPAALPLGEGGRAWGGGQEQGERRADAQGARPTAHGRVSAALGAVAQASPVPVIAASPRVFA